MEANMNPNELPLAHAMMEDKDIAIKVVGVGGAGTNCVDRLKMENLDRLRLAVMNTDLQALNSSVVQEKVLIGSSVTRGLGAGANAALGAEAAEADREKIAEVVKGADVVFLVAGLGGGTGTGAAPIVAEIAAESGALVIAFVCLPFSFEGGPRSAVAEEGLSELRKVCDAVVPLANDILLQEAGENEFALSSFARADEWIGRGIKSIWAMLSQTGLINLDFATLRQAFHTRGGKTLFGLGEGSGEDPVAEVIDSLRNCPLLATPEFARKVDRILVNLIGGTDLTLPRVNEIMTAVTEQFGREAHVVMGAVIDEDMQGRIAVMVLGTSDLGGRVPARRNPASAARPRPRVASPVPEARPSLSANAPASGTPMVADTTAKEMRHQAALATQAAQEEFFFGEIESRGYFEKTDKNLFEGQDLDVPTYQRRGIKIAF